MELHCLVLINEYEDLGPPIVVLLALLLTVATSAHAVLYKRDVRASLGWVGVIWMVPVVGALLYAMFGINRIRRKASSLRSRSMAYQASDPRDVCPPDLLRETLGSDAHHVETLARLVEDVTHRQLTHGNTVRPLIGGDEAYPAMLQAIDEAQVSVALASYIFDRDQVGLMFIDALSRAARRGVEVRLLIDDIGSRYSFPSVYGTARRAGIPVDKFMRQAIPAWLPYSNLRNHRKLLVVDGQVGFTGGLNIREGHLAKLNPRHPIQDLHFRITGPVVHQLQQTFVDDWAFTSGELLRGDRWFPDLQPAGDVLARGIVYGPDEDLGKMRLTLLGALGCAQRRVAIMTPYFLPDEALCSALNIAAMRGVQVDVILPQKNNLALVQWASTALLWQVLQHGCRIWLSPPPFDHTKLMVVDGVWSVIGSGNWDPRSLRLNFEFNVECYGRALAAELQAMFDRNREKAILVTLADVDGRALPIRLRDGVARLLTPYL